MPYRIEYAPEVEGHLRALTVRQQRILLDAVWQKGDRTMKTLEMVKATASLAEYAQELKDPLF